MKKIFAIMALLFCLQAGAQSLVLLHTNDTHSNIDADLAGRGGIFARQAVIDSVRSAEKNVILIDAGDGVQGSLYFKFFGGDVEYPLFNMLGYDVRILGNHEFDNGLDQLAAHWKRVTADRLSANYDFTNTPADGIFKPYVIKKVGNKKVGIFGINIDPKSLISEENYAGMKFEDPILVANQVAKTLKDKGCDLVVAVSHIGYKMTGNKPDDLKLAALSKDIDIIIGGHTHTFVNPNTPEKTPYWVDNAVGKPVLVTQTGKYGQNVGYIKLDLKNFSDRNIDYKLIPVTERFPESAYSKKIADFLAPYKQKVDSINNHVVGIVAMDMPNGVNTGAMPNWTADFGEWYGRQIADSLRAAGMDLPTLDMAIMNVGGIRQPFLKGELTEGRVLSAFPFSNMMQLIELKGSDLIETMRIVAHKGGEAISSRMKAVMDSDGNLINVYVDNMPVDPEQTYLIATIDYIANGNDDMLPMKNHKGVWRDNQNVAVRILEYIEAQTVAGIPLSADPNPRWIVIER